MSALAFVPEFTEHPKPRRKPTAATPEASRTNEQNNKNKNNNDDPGSNSSSSSSSSSDDDDNETDVTFLQDFVAGGLAGSASVMVGHPLDTMKVRVQNSTAPNMSIMSTMREFGGVSSLFRGMGAPLGTAALVNAIVFSSYGVGSTFYDKNIHGETSYYNIPANHDPWQKSMVCGSFAGLVQCLVICPMEHVKCRLQVQHKPVPSKSLSASSLHFKGPISATKSIVRQFGMRGLFQGWWATFWREVPAFGAYFAIYDKCKDILNTEFAKQAGLDHEAPPTMAHSHTWLASSLAGGIAGSITWGFIYPIDVIKTHIQTAPLDAARSQLAISHVARSIVQKYGWRYLFRGIGITLIRAFPVNGTIFPIYEFTLMHIKERGWGS
jgi:solute carrier family 25 carnitine/acylcarnitine transporter 20/29